MNHKYLIFIPLLMMILALQNNVLASALVLTVGTNKPSYDLGAAITVGGNLTLYGNPVSDGLVTVEVLDPSASIIAVRTMTTGTEPPKPWTIEITDLYPCDSGGNLITSVPAGGDIGFIATLKNNDMSRHSVIIVLYIQYSNNLPAAVINPFFEGTIDANSTAGPLTMYPAMEISRLAPTGTTTVCASALTAFPDKGGFAYCPEQETTFTVTDPPPSASLGNAPFSTMSSQAYSLNLATYAYGGTLGNFTVYASSKYSYYLATANVKFAVLLITDIIGSGGKPDGKVDIKDVAVVCAAFGTLPGYPRWNPIADINKDGKVTIIDVAMVVADFGKWGTLP
jgi:hypothetical protein